MLGYGMGVFNDYVDVPMPMTVFRAMEILNSARGRGSNIDRFVLEDAIKGLRATRCPWCERYRIVQLAHESKK